MQDKITLLNYDYSKWGVGEKVGQEYSTVTWAEGSSSPWFNTAQYEFNNNWAYERERQMFNSSSGVTTTQGNTTLTISGTGLSITSNNGYRPTTTMLDEMGTYQREYNLDMYRFQEGLNAAQDRVLENSWKDLTITGTSAIHVDSIGTMRSIPTI